MHSFKWDRDWESKISIIHQPYLWENFEKKEQQKKLALIIYGTATTYLHISSPIQIIRLDIITIDYVKSNNVAFVYVKKEINKQDGSVLGGEYLSYALCCPFY